MLHMPQVYWVHNKFLCVSASHILFNSEMQRGATKGIIWCNTTRILVAGHATTVPFHTLQRILWDYGMHTAFSVAPAFSPEDDLARRWCCCWCFWWWWWWWCWTLALSARLLHIITASAAITINFTEFEGAIILVVSGLISGKSSSNIYSRLTLSI